ncbi:hypothetical protein [Nocardiopsis synnemataformans]|uniref:hypothetical protein n=1 Tax=Nocardiopsis synnemataformans TaxID=61305 RepID=UPI003EBBE8A7
MTSPTPDRAPHGTRPPDAPHGALPAVPGGQPARKGSRTPRRGRDGSGARERASGLRRWAGTTPARVWLLSSVCVLAVLGLFGSAAATLGQTREDLHVLGVEAGPQALATTDLYLALADMDARVADVLLMGTDHDLRADREDALEGYEASRARANEALLQAASLTEEDEDEDEDSAERPNVKAVQDGMGAYEQLASRAQVLNDEARAPSGQVDGAALETYREATWLMHTELLPKAFNLGLEASADVRVNHGEGQSSVVLGMLWVSAAGAVAVAALLGLQLYLRVRFRRRFSAPLLAATAVAVLLTGGVVLVLTISGGQQREAKEEGLDAAMALSRAGAISTDMQADQSRYLLEQDMDDDYQADNYQQVYFERAQQVLYRPADNLEEYYTAIDGVVAAYPDLPGAEGVDPEDDPGTLGYLGQRAKDALLPDREDELAEVLESYNALQAEDRALRSAVGEGDLAGAVDIRMGVARSGDGAFQAYEDALAELTDLHEDAFDQGIARGEAALAPWTWLLPAATGLLLALVVLGIRPRLAEYR